MKILKQISKLAIIAIIAISCSTPLSLINHFDNKYNLTTEKQLENPDYSKKIDDFYNRGKEGYLKGVKDVKIYYQVFKQKTNEKAAIVISSGRTEAAVKYKELISDLYNQGYSIYIPDHRGQGLSGRMTDEHDLGYVEDFQYYIDDFKIFYDKVVKKDNHNKIFLLAHSMGGAIGITYLEQFPKDFDAAAFSSPMLALAPPTCCVIKLFNSKKPKFAPGQTIYMDDSVKFEDNHLTYSKIRYERMLKAFNETTEARLGGASVQWVNLSCKQFKYIFKKQNLEKIQTPLILFSSEDEKVVDPKGHKKFIKKMKKFGKDAEGYKVSDAMHELFVEKDEARINTLTLILDFYEKYLNDKK